jgi:hypothetical protein
LSDKKKDKHDSYIFLILNGFSDMFVLDGLNSSVGSVHSHSCLNEYTIKVIKKAQMERVKSMSPLASAVKEFMQYVAYFLLTVFDQKCKNCNEESGLVRLWPGSCLYAVRTFENPGWEDYDYVYLDERPNRFGYLGHGWTEVEKYGDTGIDMEEIDYSPVPHMKAALYVH